MNVRFGDMSWPSAGKSLGELEWTLRHSTPIRGEILRAAQILSAYEELVWCTRSKREYVVRELRREKP